MSGFLLQVLRGGGDASRGEMEGGASSFTAPVSAPWWEFGKCVLLTEEASVHFLSSLYRFISDVENSPQIIV